MLNLQNNNNKKKETNISTIPLIRRYRESQFNLQRVMKKRFWDFLKWWESWDVTFTFWLSNFDRFLWKSHPLSLQNYGEVFQLILAKHVPKPHLYPMSIRYTISLENPSWHTWLHIYSLPSINHLQNINMKKKANSTGHLVVSLVQKRSGTVTFWSNQNLRRNQGERPP